MIETREQLHELIKKVEQKIETRLQEVEKQCQKNSEKVLNAFQNNKITEAHFGSTSGYGYSDMGRDTLEKVFAEVLDAEDALVRAQMISGSKALKLTIYAL